MKFSTIKNVLAVLGAINIALNALELLNMEVYRRAKEKRKEREAENKTVAPETIIIINRPIARKARPTRRGPQGQSRTQHYQEPQEESSRKPSGIDEVKNIPSFISNIERGLNARARKIERMERTEREKESEEDANGGSVW